MSERRLDAAIGVAPFNADVDAFGGYQYTTNDRRSSLHANRRDSDLIIRLGRLDGQRVVDVGCGDGTYTAVLAAETRAIGVLGIDPAENAITAARARQAESSRLSFRCSTAAELVARGQRFDVAIYRGVLHHVVDPRQEIFDMMELADRALILEPNGRNPVLKIIERCSAYHVAHGERSFDVRRYRRWIDDAGGEVELAEYSGLVPFFCPDWFVAIASALEPLAPRVPLIRSVVCGQFALSLRTHRGERAVAGHARGESGA